MMAHNSGSLPMTILSYGAQEACHLLDSDNAWLIRHCDPLLYPDEYDQMGMIFWAAIGAAALIGIFVIRKFVFSAFAD